MPNFSTKRKGAIPLSVIRRVAQEGHEPAAADLPVTSGVADWLGIAYYLQYAITEFTARVWNIRLVPVELRSATKQGDVAEFRGDRLVLLEYNTNEDMNVVYFAYAEHVDPTR